ncbi:uncharacterized protein [Drosophila takahashii]|uniref:uncharacterized protein n=1 Tax=Drosophila takahashii TaxID=29030 RepID=UPI001CF84C47|nr:uncharacterized protein LOC108062745 [Drosophila takahashii]
MDPFRRNPILEVTKCEMCPRLVYDFVTGLCARCLTIWSGKKHVDGVRFTLDQQRAIIVSMVRGAQDLGPMDPVFRQAIEETRMLRLQKVELFQKIRQQVQLSTLTVPFYDKNPKYETTDDYWDAPEIVDEDFVKFQKQIDLLSDVPRVSLNDFDPNNNAQSQKKY